ncbi:putative cyclase [Rhodocollybia butyracea]|uniref:Cyclase n=1 Tax=Rhodocollybia butyracea TaxID=206335 RepID=A0A9P5U3C7_9AGAR|nr:putative cyclase [Rhodocollybia butyracea]
MSLPTITNLVDLSHPLDPEHMSIPPGLPQLSCCPIAQVPKDGFSMHTISLGSHTGTHVDAPSHFYADGKTIDQIPLSALVGRALVLDLTHKGPKEVIVWEDIAQNSQAGKIEPGIILLLRTGWSKHWGTGKIFWEHPYLDSSVAKELLACGVGVLGIDFASPDESIFDPPWKFPFHLAYLGGGGFIVENLTNLDKLEGPEVLVNLLPINLVRMDGAPVRAIAWK